MKKNFWQKVVYGGGVFFDLCKWLVIIASVLIVLNSFWLTIFIVDGISMEPNFNDKEIVLLDKRFVRQEKNPQRGQSVVVQYPGDPQNKRYVKRVIGLPNEKLTIKSGKVYIEDKQLVEEYLPVYFNTEPEGEWVLAENEYFLMGDNRSNSNDSRYFGPVEKRFFIGKAVAILFPRLRFVELPNY